MSDSAPDAGGGGGGHGGGSAGGAAGGSGGGVAGGAAGGSAGSAGGGSAGGAAGGSGGGSAGGAGGGSGGGSACNDPIIDADHRGSDIVFDSVDVSQPIAFHSAAIPFNPSSEKPISTVAFVANGTTYLLLGTVDSGIQAWNVGLTNQARLTALAVGPGRYVNNIPCAEVIGATTVNSLSEIFLTGPSNSCWSNQSQLPQWLSGLSTDGLAVAGVTAGGLEQGGSSAVAFGATAVLCADTTYPACLLDSSSRGPLADGGTNIGAIPDGGWRTLDVLVELDGGKHWILTDNVADAGLVRDLAGDPSGNRDHFADISGSPASTSMIATPDGVQYVAVTVFSAGDGGANKLDTLFQRPDSRYQLSAQGSEPLAADATSLRTLTLALGDGGTALRAVWITDGGVSYSDAAPKPGAGIPGWSWTHSAIDHCSSNVVFAAPLTAEQILTIDTSGHARVHKVPN